MALATLENLISEARLYSMDTDTTDPALTDAQWTMLVNKAYQDFMALFPDLLVDTVGSVTLVNGTYKYTLNNLTGKRFRDLTIAENTTNGDVPIERASFEELLSLVGQQTNIIPRSWAATRSSSDMTSWTIYFVPTPTSTPVITFRGHVQPQDLTSGQSPICGDAECHWIAGVAAARGARLIGRPYDFVQNIIADLPQFLQAEMFVVKGATRPFNTDNEVTA